LEISENKLIIGIQNPEIFTSDKQLWIQQSANNFFQRDFKVDFRESSKSKDLSLRAEELADRKQKKIKRTETAKNSPLVQDILKIFPESSIEKVTFLQENEE